MEMASFGNKRSYDDFKRQIPAPVAPLFDSLRDFCFSLGDNVIEDVRMHRVVFCKSMTFRWFADVAPTDDGVIIKIQRSRKEQPLFIEVKADQDTTKLTGIIRDAYNEIH